MFILLLLPLFAACFLPWGYMDVSYRMLGCFQALHVGAVVEVLLRLYTTCDQPGANGFHSPTAVGLLQQVGCCHPVIVVVLCWGGGWFWRGSWWRCLWGRWCYVSVSSFF